MQPSDSNDDSRLGSQVGDYRVQATVADGSTGRVYQAYHVETEEHAALKVLHPWVASDPVSVERFRRECETLLKLRHPHIVQAYTCGATPEGTPFLAMEFLSGHELDVDIRGGGLEAAAVVRLVAQVALGIEYAHRAGIVHRDLKPQNIFLAESNAGPTAKILDFGSIKRRQKEQAHITALGTTLGSPYYMSPEQARGQQDLDARTDIFSLASVTFESLTGAVAYRGRNVGDIVAKIVQGPSPMLVEGGGGTFPDAADDVLMRAWARDPAARTATAREFAAALARAFGCAGTPEEVAAMPLSEVRVRIQQAQDARATSSVTGDGSLQPLRQPASRLAIWVAVALAAGLLLWIIWMTIH